MNLEQLVAGKTKAEITIIADKLEKLADAAPAKGAGIKGAGAKAVAAKTTATKTIVAPGIGAKGAGAKSIAAKTATGMTAKSGSASSIAACCTTKSWSLGLGLGLGAWGPVLLIAGTAAAGWYAYNKFYKEDPDIDAPAF